MLYVLFLLENRDRLSGGAFFPPPFCKKTADSLMPMAAAVHSSFGPTVLREQTAKRHSRATVTWQSCHHGQLVGPERSWLSCSKYYCANVYPPS